MGRVSLLWERDAARAKLIPLQKENEHLRMLLKYAQEAIMAEYQLRVAATQSDKEKP